MLRDSSLEEWLVMIIIHGPKVIDTKAVLRAIGSNEVGFAETAKRYCYVG